MRRMKPPQNALYNGEQTCIFYALEALFHTHGIWTEPIITRNTTYCNEKELPAFFNHFLCKGNDYPCHYKKIKDVSFPNNSIIAIIINLVSTSFEKRCKGTTSLKILQISTILLQN